MEEEEEKLENKHGRGKEEVEIGREDVTPPPHYSNSHPLTQRTPPGHAMQRSLPSKQEGEGKRFFLKKSFGKKRFVTLDKSFYPVCGSSLALYHPSPRSPKEEKATSHPSHVRTSAYMCFPPLPNTIYPQKKQRRISPTLFFRER